jgi:Asp-tRNA(Asn)/Glu-tRNA(Gln) amidotransferase A subunit family amidase
VIDVAVADIDARYRMARGSEPGALKTAWNVYLARGAQPGDKVLTIDDLLASGKLVPRSVNRFRDAMAPIPTGDELRRLTASFYASREEFRKLFTGLLDANRLDALLYPANLARPHTHEGGLERFGGEPSTCIESAGTGLPQVTVPAGFVAGRYPIGVSLLGRMWADARMLSLAYAYEQATHHRHPPPTVH